MPPFHILPLCGSSCGSSRLKRLHMPSANGLKLGNHIPASSARAPVPACGQAPWERRPQSMPTSKAPGLPGRLFQELHPAFSRDAQRQPVRIHRS